MEATEYISLLPVERTREIHLTGIQHIDDRWIAVMRDAGVSDAVVAQYAGRWQDHLPLTDADWEFTGWSLAQIAGGHWGAPWIVSFEYGGIGPIWETFTDPAILAEQVPRLAAMVGAIIATNQS
jgi:uncharacterized protein